MPRPEPGSETPSVPDMTASLKAKVSVSDADQADPGRLASVYDGMWSRFLDGGLNLEAIRAVQQYYSGVEGGAPRPLPYACFPTPIPLGAVRLFVVFFQDHAPALTRAAAAAARALGEALPEAGVHVNEPADFHVTVYMTSQPHTLRGDPFDASAPAPERPEQAVPREPTLAREKSVGRELAAGTVPPRLRAHRVLLADSGTLLLTLVDDSGLLAPLRSKLREGFPNGPPRQSTIVHASLARILRDRPLTPSELEAVRCVCDEATLAVRGQAFTPSGLHHIQEETFTTVAGPREFLPFAPLGST